MTTLDDLWEEPRLDSLPPLDQGTTPITDLQEGWQTDGVVILPGFMGDAAIDRYNEAYVQGGIPTFPTAHVGQPGSFLLRDLALWDPLAYTLEHLIGEPMGLHLTLTGWTSSQRDWHQDDYLNPPEVEGFYCAVWMALGDIHPDSGPFEFVRGSHRWPALRQAKVLAALGEDGSDAAWPWRSEALLSPLFEEKIKDEGHQIESFCASKGDVLIWHTRLLHRGSRPHVLGMERRALITHYSGVNHRPDMPRVERHGRDGLYFVP